MSYTGTEDQGLGPLSTAFWSLKQRGRSEVAQPGLTLLPKWDVGAAGGNLTYHAIVPPPHSPLLLNTIIQQL